jgi:hypothetical protein
LSAREAAAGSAPIGSCLRAYLRCEGGDREEMRGDGWERVVGEGRRGR